MLPKGLAGTQYAYHEGSKILQPHGFQAPAQPVSNFPVHGKSWSRLLKLRCKMTNRYSFRAQLKKFGRRRKPEVAPHNSSPKACDDVPPSLQSGSNLPEILVTNETEIAPTKTGGKSTIPKSDDAPQKSNFDDDYDRPKERLSRKDSFGRELGDVKTIHESSETAATPIAGDAATAVISLLPPEVQTSKDSLHLWDDAYQWLRTEANTANLVKAYERILTAIHVDPIVLLKLTNEAPNNLEDCDSKERRSRMREMTQLSLVRMKKHESFHQGAQGVIDFVNATSSMVGTMLTAYPAASIAWSGICAILPIVLATSVQRLAMRDGLFYVMEKLEWCMAVSGITSSQLNFDGNINELYSVIRFEISKLYRGLLEFEMKSVCACYDTSPLVGALRAIINVDDWSTRVVELKKIETQLESYLHQFGDASAMASLAKISQSMSSFPMLLDEVRRLHSQGEQERRKQDEIRRQVLIARFSTETTCPYRERMMAVPPRVDGTCEWFQTHARYNDWRESPSSQLLLLSADPGCGKSVLSRFLAEEVLPAKQPGATICYFFFKDSPDQNNLSAALCALIHQILSQTPELTDLVSDKITTNGTALMKKESVLWDIFETITSRRAGSDVICVLDALDECQKADRMVLAERLRSVVEGNSDSSPGRIKLLVTTRGYPEITRLFQGMQQGYIRLSGENKAEVDQIQTEIALVSNHKLEQLAKERGFTDKRKQQIRDALVRKGGEQRTYLWVKLVFEVLEANWRNQQPVWKSIINTLPETVYDAYDKLLGKVYDRDRERVRMLFELMMAAYRPLPLETAIRLLNAREFSDSDTEVSDELDWESASSFEVWVKETCGIFVTTYDQQLFFIHQTAKEFLEETRRTNNGLLKDNSTFRHSIPVKKAHRTIVENCIAFRRYGGTKWKDETSKYLGEFWTQHFRDSQDFDKTRSDDCIVQDIDEQFWDGYESLWHDEEFIRSQVLSSFLARHDRDTFKASFTDYVRLALIATHGHYRLLEKELRSCSEKNSLAAVPCLMTSGDVDSVESKCASLLSKYAPQRPVICIIEDNSDGNPRTALRTIR